MKFEPIALDHAARLIGERPWTVSRSGALLAEALVAAVERYRLETCIVGIDIYNVEAEAYGCTVMEPDGNGVSAIASPITGSVEEIRTLSFDPSAGGRIPMVLEAGRRIAESTAGCEVRIAMAGPFTIACHLLGIENMICELMLDPDNAAAALDFIADNQLGYGRVIGQHGFGITIFESSVTPPLLSPRLFSDHVAPALGKMINGIRNKSHSGIQLVIGGNTLPILESQLALRPDYIICPIETDQHKFISGAEEDPGVVIRVNMNPGVFLNGNETAALREARRALELAQARQNCTVGCLLPFDADPEVVVGVADFLRTANESGS